MLIAMLKDLTLQIPTLETAKPDSNTFRNSLGKAFAHFLQVFGDQYST